MSDVSDVSDKQSETGRERDAGKGGVEEVLRKGTRVRFPKGTRSLLNVPVRGIVRCAA